MENSELEKLKNTLDTILIETALNTAHLKALTLFFHRLSSEVLDPEVAKDFRSYYYHTLLEQTSDLLNHQNAHMNQTKAINSLFDLNCFVQNQLKDL